MNERVDENIHILPQPRTGQKPSYLQQEVLDKAVEDGERKLMERMKHKAFDNLIKELEEKHPEEMEEARKWAEDFACKIKSGEIEFIIREFGFTDKVFEEKE